MIEFLKSVPGWAILPLIIAAFITFGIVIAVLHALRLWIAMACSIIGVYQMWQAGADYPIAGVLFGLIPLVILSYFSGDADVDSDHDRAAADANANYQRRTRENYFR